MHSYNLNFQNGDLKVLIKIRTPNQFYCVKHKLFMSFAGKKSYYKYLIIWHIFICNKMYRQWKTWRKRQTLLMVYSFPLHSISSILLFKWKSHLMDIIIINIIFIYFKLHTNNGQSNPSFLLYLLVFCTLYNSEKK